MRTLKKPMVDLLRITDSFGMISMDGTVPQETLFVSFLCDFVSVKLPRQG
jgi:hypothetical protein